MDSNNESSGLSSYYHHPQQPPPPPQTTTTSAVTTTSAAASPTNGIGPNPISNSTNNINANVPTSGASQMVYSHAVPSAVTTPLETVKRKRGRPRKYGTPEQAAAAKRLAASASSTVSLPKKRDQALGAAGGSSSASSSKKTQLAALGNVGQSFTPHVITVNAGEDVGQKIWLFVQQSKREICVLSASGSVSNASLRQPATSGGNITYEGRFEIISLNGSYVRTELGGRSGGLSVCLSSSDGQIVGGSVGGPLTAAGPIQVTVGSFVIDTKKDVTGGSEPGMQASKLPSPAGATSVSGMSFRSPADSPQHNFGGSQYMIQPRGGMHMTPSQSMEWRANSGHGVQQSPENGDYDHIPE